jgi:ectoine hydroxylase-related dioxygenase (phytanoyl-CoA dioxygenase family)
MTLMNPGKLSVADAYVRDGFALAPGVIPLDLVSRVSQAMDAIAARPPFAGLPADKLRKMDQQHIDNPVIHELVSHPAIGRLVAEATGAKFAQVFATQTLIKPSAPADAAGNDAGNVGWHQDLQYWDPFLEGELLTAWIAISDVTPRAGPMRFVRGSHRWGLLNAGNFFSGELDQLKQNIRAKYEAPWEEVPAVLRPGGVSLHHKLTVHGSGPNAEPWPRKSVAIHLRTENSALKPGVEPGAVGWLNDFSDRHRCPVILGN